VTRPSQTLRGFAVEQLTTAFGEPERLQTVYGLLYRWRLKSSDESTIRLTLDSPEFTNVAHLLISDPGAVIRLAAETCRTEGELLEVIAQIRSKLAGERNPEEGSATRK
jgi:hypothetical protein